MARRYNRWINKYYLFIYFALIIVLFSCIISHILTGNIEDGLRFGLFQIVVVFIPGLMIQDLLFDESANKLYKLATSYFCGYSFTIFIYFLIVPMKLQKYSNFIICACIVILVMIYVSKLQNLNSATASEGEFSEREKHNAIIVFGLLGFILFVQLFTYVGCNIMPPVVNDSILYDDCLYWIGNIIELSREFPPKDFRNYPANYNYHYFSSLQLALVSISTGIRATILGYGFSIIQSASLCVFGIWMLTERLVQTPIYRLIACISVFFASGFENITIITYSTHLFVGSFGFDYGLAWFLFFWAMLITLSHDSNVSKRRIVIVWISMLILCGIKASFAAVAIVGLGVVCLVWCFKMKTRQAIQIGIPSLIVFVLMYFLVTNIQGYGGELSNVIKQMTMYEAQESIRNLYNIVSSILPLGSVVEEIVFNIIYALLCNPMAYGILLYTILRHHKKIQFIDLGLWISIFVGLFINMYIYMNGASNMYFMMATYPLAILLGLHYIDRGINKKCNKYEIGLVIVLFILSVCGWSQGYGKYNTCARLRYGFVNAFIEEQQDNLQKGAYINKNQFNAMEWVRVNKKDELIMTTNRNPADRLTGVFTECYYVDCGLYVDESQKMLDEDIIVKKIKDSGVKYILRFKDEEWNLKESDFEKEYENEEVIVYYCGKDD